MACRRISRALRKRLTVSRIGRSAQRRTPRPSSQPATRSGESRMRLSSLILLLPILAAGPLVAQSAVSPDLFADWQRNRATVLKYIDAMPDSATGFRPTPGVRTFAQQFDHIVSTNLDVAAIALRGLRVAPQLGDSGVYLHDKAALRRYADTTYAYPALGAQASHPRSTPTAGGVVRPAAAGGRPPGDPVLRACRMDSGSAGAVPPAERRNAPGVSDAVLRPDEHDASGPGATPGDVGETDFPGGVVWARGRLARAPGLRAPLGRGHRGLPALAAARSATRSSIPWPRVSTAGRTLVSVQVVDLPPNVFLSAPARS